MVAVHAAIVDGKLVEDHVTWRSHLEGQVNGNVLVPQMAISKESKGEKRLLVHIETSEDRSLERSLIL